MSNQKKTQNKKNTTLQRIIWGALVILAIALISLWTFEPEVIEVQKEIVEPTGEVTNQVRIPLNTNQKKTDQQSPAATDENGQTAQTDLSDQQLAPIAPQIKKVTEDSVVRPEFINRLAQLLVNAYRPKGSHPLAENSGVMLIDAKSLNVHFGIEMTGLEWSGDDLAIGRRTVMRYALRPSMINALYALYKDRLLAAVAEDLSAAKRTVQGQERELSAEEQREFYKLTAQKTRATASVLKACADSESTMAAIGDWLQSERDALAANQKFQSALHDYQISVDVQATKVVLESAEEHMKKQGAAYENAIRNREALKNNLANLLNKHEWAKAQDNETNRYIASWVYRRSKELANPKEALIAIHDSLVNLASTMDEKAK